MWSSFTIASPDAPAVVRARLLAAVTKRTLGRLSGSTTFRGKVRGDEFRITLNPVLTDYKLPITAKGRLIPAGNGTTVEVRTRPQVWVLLVLSAWSAFWGSLLWSRLVSNPLPGGIHRGEIVVLVGFVAFMWGLAFIAATVQERLYKQELTQILVPTKSAAALGSTAT